jgi:Phage P22-like portal protein
MSSNSGDNWDLIGDIPGERGKLPNTPGFEIEDNGALLSRIRNFYDEGVGAWEENRRMHSEDLNFIYNSEAQGQWDPVVLQNRRGKPCYTFNRVLQPVNMVVADMRQTSPAGKVRPASDGASEPVADIFGGLCRSIEQCSRADGIYKEQFKFAVAGGFGAWRVMPTYMANDGDGAFDQVLRLINITNPQTVVWDPQCADPCGGDANRCIVAERVAEEIYEQLYRDGDGESFTVSRDSYGWFTDKEVRIAEYFERIPRNKKIAKMTNGTVVEYDADLKAQEAHFDEHGIDFASHGVTRVATDKNGKKMIRDTVVWQVMWVKCDGSNVLEGPYYYDWKRIPVIRCPGRYVNIEGRKKFQSLIRHSKDAQRSYNSRASDMIERSALLPKAPYLVTETMIKGYEDQWNQANVQSRPYLPYNPDPKAPEAMPSRVAPLDLPQGAMALAQMSIQDIQATIGYFDPALGNSEDMNRVSGKALVQHTKRSDLGSFEFIDGFQQALQLTWEMLIDMIPTVMDSERVERIIGHDGIEKMVTVNQTQDGTDDLINDLSKGSYDVQVTIGPSFQSARQESLDALIALSEALPNTAPLISDLIAKNVDVPDAQEMAKRLRIPLIKQGLIEPNDEEKQKGLGPAPPDPKQKAEQDLLDAKVGKMKADATIASSRAEIAPLEQQKQQFETAGKHLGNLVMQQQLQQGQQDLQSSAQEAQTKAQSDMMDLAKKHVDHQQDLQHAAHDHHQGLQHEQQEHTAGVLKDRAAAEEKFRQEREEHAHELKLERERFEHEKALARDRHTMDMELAREKHALDLKNAKELNAAKASAARKPKAA